MMYNTIADSIRFQSPPRDIHTHRRVKRQLCGLTSYSRRSTPTPLFARGESTAVEAQKARWERCRWKLEEIPRQTALHGSRLQKKISKEPGLRRAAQTTLLRHVQMLENVQNRCGIEDFEFGIGGAARNGRNAVSLVLSQGACKPPPATPTLQRFLTRLSRRHR
jgi:hypothetical protein